MLTTQGCLDPGPFDAACGVAQDMLRPGDDEALRSDTRFGPVAVPGSEGKPQIEAFPLDGEGLDGGDLSAFTASFANITPPNPPHRGEGLREQAAYSWCPLRRFLVSR